MGIIISGDGYIAARKIFLPGSTSGNTTLSASENADLFVATLPAANGTLLIDSWPDAAVLTPNITPTQITSDTDDWAPTGYANARMIRANTSDTWSLGGLTHSTTDFANTNFVVLLNVGPNRLLLNHEANTSTAANRFYLGEDQVVLYANACVFLTYNNTLSRWLDPGGERKVGKGFFSGGQTTGPTNSLVADRTTYATETTAAVPGGNLSVARWLLSAAGNATKGFFSGGTAAVTNIADRTTYATEVTAAVSGANLSLARYGLAAAGNATKGFFSGGATPTVSAVADRTTYATEVTAAVSGANLSVAREGPGAAGNATKGFFSGGDTGTVSAVADRTTYATEVTAAVSGANLSVARFDVAPAGTTTKGFFCGGDLGGASMSAVADRTTYATEVTAAVSGANLSVARRAAAAAGTGIF
jgi:hypothetical protein